MSTEDGSVQLMSHKARNGEFECKTVSPNIEMLTAAELAARLKVRESWVVEMTKPSRTSDPIPTKRLGKHKRYLWGSKALMAWLDRR